MDLAFAIPLRGGQFPHNMTFKTWSPESRCGVNPLLSFLLDCLWINWTVDQLGRSALWRHNALLARNAYRYETCVIAPVGLA